MADDIRTRRATKKQRELLAFLDSFIKTNGYGPSYREIMHALDYKSVSTVATHINGLIARGYVTKTDDSARSLAVVSAGKSTSPSHEQWLRAALQQHRRKLAHSATARDRQTVQAIDRVAELFDISL